jgi:nitrogen fixation-related uncharacterized protein
MVPIIALFARLYDAVATDLYHALATAAIKVSCVAVITFFWPISDAITATFKCAAGGTNAASGAATVTLFAGLHNAVATILSLALASAAIEVYCVAVVTFFWPISEAVTTMYKCAAEGTKAASDADTVTLFAGLHNAVATVLSLALATAAIEVNGVAVVTLFWPISDAVTTTYKCAAGGTMLASDAEYVALFARLYDAVATVLSLALATAAIEVNGVAVVTFFWPISDAVTTTYKCAAGGTTLVSDAD